MIELIQFPWSPFCIVQRQILQFAGAPFKVTNLPNTSDRSLVWKLTKHRYYAVPIIRDRGQVVFETGDDSQVIAKYLDEKFRLGLFPAEIEGVQEIIWRYIENEVEGVCFKLNDIYFQEFVAKDDQLPFLRHKERKFGRGCIEGWRAQQPELRAQLETVLVPFEQMLAHNDFLLGERPRFVDIDLYGMLGNYLFSGHYRLPAQHKNILRWHRHLGKTKFSKT